MVPVGHRDRRDHAVLRVVHQPHAEGPLLVQSNDAQERVAADAGEGETEAFDFELGLAFADLLDDEVVDLLVELDGMVPAVAHLAIDELQLRIRLTHLHGHHVLGFQEMELSKCALEVMDAPEKLRRNRHRLEGVVGVKGVGGLVRLQLDARLDHDLVVDAL